jgi:hypothetical protein
MTSPEKLWVITAWLSLGIIIGYLLGSAIHV